MRDINLCYLRRIFIHVLEAAFWQEIPEHLDDLREQLKEKASSDILEESFYDAITVLALPEKYCQRLRTTNMVERLIQEVHRRTKVNPNPPEQGVTLAARWHSPGRETRGMFHWATLLDDG